ncbi:hypothetical protein, partial [Microcoleus sp. Pol12B4]|uniref:hypothetical protein n=1 Tax=Microcoleus sp. Pol12B4 TaxID=3055395 RepID=UPI002FD426CE
VNVERPETFVMIEPIVYKSNGFAIALNHIMSAVTTTIKEFCTEDFSPHKITRNKVLTTNLRTLIYPTLN